MTIKGVLIHIIVRGNIGEGPDGPLKMQNQPMGTGLATPPLHLQNHAWVKPGDGEKQNWKRSFIHPALLEVTRFSCTGQARESI
jgi:hypothetical protein